MNDLPQPRPWNAAAFEDAKCAALAAAAAGSTEPGMMDDHDIEPLSVDRILFLLDTARTSDPDPRLTLPRHLRAWCRVLAKRVKELERLALPAPGP